MKYPIVFFRDTSCTLRFDKYRNGNLAIQLVCPDGSPMATATVNVFDYNPPKGHALIKDYSENKGILQALQAAGVVKDTGRTVQCGQAAANLVKLLIEI